MKRFFAISVVSAVLPAPLPAMAGELPKAMLVDTNVLAQVQGYLARRPYNEVAGLIAAMDGCLSLQVEQGGAVRSTGQCPEVWEVNRQRDEALAAALKRAQDAEGRLKSGSQSGEK